MTKVCPHCNRELPTTSFCSNKARKDGLAAYCRECSSAMFKEYRQTDRFKEVASKWRDENADKIREQNRLRMREYSKTEKYREYKREYEKSEKYKEWSRANAAKPANRARHTAYNAKPEAVAQRQAHQSTDEFKSKRRAYRQSDKGKQAISTAAHNRRAIERGLRKDLTTKQWRIIIAMYDGKCAYCGSSENVQQEHVIPISKGGGTTFSNIVPACKKCNMSKKHNLLLRWFLRGIPNRNAALGPGC